MKNHNKVSVNIQLLIIYFLRLMIIILFVDSMLLASSEKYILEKNYYKNIDKFSYTFNGYKDKNSLIDDSSYNTLPIHTIDTRYEKLVTELAYMQVFAVATIGVIALLPESISQWSSEDKTFTNAQDLLQKHADNVAKGPVWDNDTWQINYIGHSVAGAYFYVWGRQSGLTWQESTILTTLMSTFYWEYGWEAFAEVPSVQDLIITPVLGSLLGEYTNHLYTQLMQNEGKIYDSYLLGGVGRVILNPIGEMNTYLDKAFDAANIEISVDYAYNQNQNSYRSQQSLNQRGMIQSYFKFNFTLKY